MGTDIHLAVERERISGWERVLPPPEAYDPWLKEQAEKETTGEMGEYYREHVKQVWYDDRNYNLFAILADVRNEFDFVPISQPKGLPDDLSQSVRKLVDDPEMHDIWLGEHSHSWLSLEELLNYDWNQETMEGGWVDPWNFELWRSEGKPRSWSGGVGEAGIRHISVAEMAEMIDSGELQWEGPEPGSVWGSRKYRMRSNPSESSYEHFALHYCTVKWKLTYKEAAGRFFTQIIPELERLGSPKSVRIVFGFDS